jgi:hypothetical protein
MIDKHQAFEAWYKANYALIAGTSSWVERARAAYYAGAMSMRDRVAELERERKMSNRASQQRDMLMLSLGLCLVTGSPDKRGMVNPKWVNARAESAEQRAKELEEELIHNVNEAKRVESLSEENRKLRELIVYFYGGRFSSYWSELQEWKRTGATHAPGALVERDYEKAKELAALLRPSEAMTGKVEKGE